MKQFHRGEITYEQWCDKAVEYYRQNRLTKDLIEETARTEARLTKNFLPGIAELKRLGYKTALISGGVDVFLNVLIPDAKSIFDDVFINHIFYDYDGVVAGVRPTKYDYAGKAEALKLLCEKYGFDLEETIFVGDRFNDLEAILAAGHSILYSDSRDSARHKAHHEILDDDFHVLVDHVKGL